MLTRCQSAAIFFRMRKQWPQIRKTTNHGNPVLMVDARHGGKGERKFFIIRAEAEGFAQAQRIRRMNEGASAFEDRELASFGWTIQQAIRFAVDYLKKQKASVPVESAIDSLLASKIAAGRSANYCRTLRINLRKLASEFSGRSVSTITTPEVESFLAALLLAPATKNTIRRDCVTLWTHAVKSGWAEKNVAEETDMTTTVDSTPGIFTPAQVAALLSASKNDVLAFHAIGLFAGLRVSEIKRLDWSDVDLAGGYIHVSAAESKTRSRRLVPILDALRAWITPVAKISGMIIQANFRKRERASRAAAAITHWPDNAMRHSFVSYRLADTGNVAQTALESGHDQAVLFRHYRELVRPNIAKRYFRIRPVGRGKVVAMADAA